MPEKVVIGSAELWHADCREVLPLLPQHDLVLTDPPYGIGYAANPIVGKGKKASQIGAETVARRTQVEGRNPGTLHGLSRRADLAIPLHAAHNLGKKESTPDAMARRTKLMRSAI